MEIFGAAIMVMSLIMAWQTIKNGSWIKNILKEIHERGEQRHGEVIEMMKGAQLQHQDIIELLKKGFGA